MFGVLVFADAGGRVGYLRGFSGMLGGGWHLEGFVPPLFDEEVLHRVWPAGEAELNALNERHDALASGSEPVALRENLAVIVARHEAELAAMAARHATRRQQRKADRLQAGGSEALDQQSRADKAERRRLIAEHEQERAALTGKLQDIEVERVALERFRADRSRQLWQDVHDAYVVTNARGERRGLRDLFAPQVPPGGAGDCAAPKLLQHAFRHGLRPLALAEFWWGAPPLTGGRHSGLYYPPCRGKCGPLLAFMLVGLPADPSPDFGAETVAADEPRTVFEDRWIVVVEKPCGLLSVPGGSARLRDSVLTRLQARYPDATGPLLVHRLDLDTSGLLLAARTMDTYVALQRQFARREIDKRYVAWLEGSVAADRGHVDLALRVDLDDRPRQIYDPEHGLAAQTDWQVLARTGARTRVALFPRTGRTHQLRVHAAHPLGIGVPIVGDRLYGRSDERLMLHAEALSFVHPVTGARVALERPALF